MRQLIEILIFIVLLYILFKIVKWLAITALVAGIVYFIIKFLKKNK